MIRAARAGDEPSLMAIYNACFPGEEDFCRWFFGRVYRPENTLVWDEGGILAAVQLLPVRLMLAGQEVQATYIYAAGTLPQFRGKGLMAALLAHSFAVSAARGDWLSVLITQEPSLLDYYARFGYRPVFARQKCAVQAQPLPLGAAVRMMETRDIADVQRLYGKAQNSLYALRDHAAWELILQQYGSNACVLENVEQECVAFALLEGGENRLFATEALGPKAATLMAAQAERLGFSDANWFAPGESGGELNGCARPLCAEGEALLEALPRFGYLNVLFN